MARQRLIPDVLGEDEVPPMEAVPADKAATVFFVDDSALARKKITEVLEQMKLPSQFATNGREALERLQAMADRANGRLHDSLGLILVDAEMPEMDGYVLTRHLKADARFADIPVVMHSSLSSVANRKLGQQVGVDAYIAKFHSDELGREIASRLAQRQEARQ